MVLIKFEQVEAGERNFFVSLVLAVRETCLQGAFWNLASLNREYPEPFRKHINAIAMLCKKLSVSSYCHNAGWVPFIWLCPVTEDRNALAHFSRYVCFL